MANIIYNNFKAKMADGTYRWNTQPLSGTAGSRVKVALMKVVAVTSDAGQDLTALDAVLTGSKEYGGSYTRPTLASVAVVNDTTSNHAELGADDQVVTVPDDSGASVVGLVVFIDPTGSAADSLCVPVCYMDVTTFVGNGANVTFVWNAEGLMKLV